MISRLQAIRSDLADQIEQLDAAAQRRVALVVLERVAQAVPGIHDAVEVVRAGDYGRADVRDSLENAALAFEDDVFEAEDELQQAQDAGHDHAAELVRYKTARGAQCAYMAAYFALSNDPNEAAQETSYEARYVLPEADVEQVVRQLSAL